MKQKELTEKQKEILNRLNAVLDEAVDAQIGFVYDNDDFTLSAYNNENVIDGYAGRKPEEENDTLMNWDEVFIISKRFDYFDNAMQSYYLHFTDEAV